MEKKKLKKSEPTLARIGANIDTLIENDKLVLAQFDKLQDEVGEVRNDVYEMKSDITNIKVRLYEVERDIKTVKRISEEEQGKRKDLEHRIRHVLPDLPNATRS